MSAMLEYVGDRKRRSELRNSNKGKYKSNSFLPFSNIHFEIPLEGLTIGRDLQSQLVLPSSNVSREHARIVRRASAYVIEDVGSYNGTFVNDRNVAMLAGYVQVIDTKAPRGQTQRNFNKGYITLSNGDEVNFGNSPYRFRFRIKER